MVKTFFTPKKTCSAAAKIQAVARGRIARSKSLKKVSRKHVSATKIQALARKRRSAEKEKKKKEAKIAKALKQLA
jgi:hypothetical protein